MKLLRELLLGAAVIFFGSWLLSFSLMLMSLPNDAAVIGGGLLSFLAVVGIGASALRHGRMLWNYIERMHNA